MKYVINPNLICIKSDVESLTFSHYGNIFVYNSLAPQVTLQLLGILGRPITLEKLCHQMERVSSKLVRSELKRLVSNFYVSELKSRGRPGMEPLSPLLHHIRDPKLALAIEAKLKKSKIVIVDLVGFSKCVKDGLKKMHFKNTVVTDMPKGNFPRSDLSIVIGSSAHKLQISNLNQIFKRLKKTWMLVSVDHFGGIIGPTFSPAGGGPCFDCILDRSHRNYESESGDGDYLDHIKSNKLSISSPDLHGLSLSLGPFIAIEAAKIVSGVLRPLTTDGFVKFDFMNFRMKFIPCGRSPTCPSCLA